MSKIKTVSFTVAPVLMWALYFTPAIVSQAGSTASVLTGTVKSKDGKSMEGVGVSARNDTQTFTTTVYTNQNGAYSFPQLDDGHYKIWAQAVGFDAAVKQTSLVSGQSGQVELTLTPIEHYEKQLSGVEWVASLPEKPGDERMKVLITTNCTGCHTASFPLQNRFDLAGWRRILDLMAKISSEGYIREGAKTDEVITAYEDELAEYLARVRGPDSKLDLKPLPRPTGEATRIVVTEYDLTRPDMPPGWLMKHNGSDWSEGTPSRWDGRSAHDVALDKNGNVWFADDSTPDRTVGKLDPRTGKVTDYKLPSATKVTESTHAIAIDRDGNVWLADNTEGNPLEFDPKTSTFHKFPRPADFPFVGDFVAVDLEGNAWSPTTNGAYKLDPRTGEYTNYSTGQPGARHYDLTVDRLNHVWVALIGGSRILKVNPETGKVDEINLGFRDDVRVTPRDREITATKTMGPDTSTPLQKGPRRMAADMASDYVWFTENFADRLAKVNIHTGEVSEYPVPHKYSQPYAVTVDKHHNVWITMISSDRIAKFNPDTGKFTEYQMPTLGTEIRHIQVDDSTDPPTVWVPYVRTNKITRIQFSAS